ncbi:hypothetical protein [Treponema sp. R8-4-B8]
MLHFLAVFSHGALAHLKVRRIFTSGDFIVRHAMKNYLSTRLNAVHYRAGVSAIKINRL